VDVDELTFDDFRRLATDLSLSPHERIGFPDSYREGKEEAIFADIRSKLPQLDGKQKVVVDIGPGCGALANLIIRRCREHSHRLVLVDSEEMLAQLPDGPEKVTGPFPTEVPVSQADVILVYSVLHYVEDRERFVEACLGLLGPSGTLLIGDIPNVAMRKRFLTSDAGRAFHRAFSGRDEDPPPEVIEREGIGDEDVLALLALARRASFDAFVVPQAPGLPMANRREDILIRRP
jgi:SAM-dependent methyltransferase